MEAIPGTLVGLSARVGTKNQTGWKALLNPILKTVAATGLAAATAGWWSYVNPGDQINRGHLFFQNADPFTFYTCLGAASSIALCFWIIWERLRSPAQTLATKNPQQTQ